MPLKWRWGVPRLQRGGSEAIPLREMFYFTCSGGHRMVSAGHLQKYQQGSETSVFPAWKPPVLSLGMAGAPPRDAAGRSLPPVLGGPLLTKWGVAKAGGPERGD